MWSFFETFFLERTTCVRPYVNKEVCKIPTFFLFEIFFYFVKRL